MSYMVLSINDVTYAMLMCRQLTQGGPKGGGMRDVFFGIFFKAVLNEIEEHKAFVFMHTFVHNE